MAALRAELAAVEPVRGCCRDAERSALAAARGPRSRDPVLARLAVKLERSSAAARAPFEVGSARDHCLVAYLRGLFLARGSLSFAAGGTHLEFVVPEADAESLAGAVARLGLSGSWRIRRGTGVVTWKGAETVLRFLRLAGATSAVLEFESQLVTRALRADLNRVVNAEEANLERSVTAARTQLEAIAKLEGDGRLDGLPAGLREMARARREAPEATLAELAARVGLPRSRVQRALERIVSLALGGAGPGTGAVGWRG